MPHSTIPILIIEDSPEDYEALVRAFTKAAVNNPVYRFSYGEDAYDFLKHRGQYFKHGAESQVGLVILDLNLPGTDGLSILRSIRGDSALAATPVIVLSSSSSAREVRDSYLAGANCYIVKPSDPADFAELVLRVKEFWLQTVTLPSDTSVLRVVLPRRAATRASPGSKPDAD